MQHMVRLCGALTCGALGGRERERERERQREREREILMKILSLISYCSYL